MDQTRRGVSRRNKRNVSLSDSGGVFAAVAARRARVQRPHRGPSPSGQRWGEAEGQRDRGKRRFYSARLEREEKYLMWETQKRAEFRLLPDQNRRRAYLHLLSYFVYPTTSNNALAFQSRSSVILFVRT